MIQSTSGDRDQCDLCLFFQGFHQVSCHTGLRRLARSLTALPYDIFPLRAIWVPMRTACGDFEIGCRSDRILYVRYYYFCSRVAFISFVVIRCKV